MDDLTVVSAIDSWLTAMGLTLGTPTPLGTSPVTPPWDRYEWGSPPRVRLDIAPSLAHAFPRPPSAPFHGALLAWKFFKLWS